MKTNQVTDVSKFSTIKAEYFDEAILVVQVWVGKFEIRDVLLDGEFWCKHYLKEFKK
jgi:hypothetical protein